MSKNSKEKSKKSGSKRSSKGRNKGKKAQLAGIMLMVALVLFVVFYVGDNIWEVANDPVPQQKEQVQNVEKSSAGKSKKKPAKKKKKEDKRSKRNPEGTPKASRRHTEGKKSNSLALKNINPERDLLPSFDFAYTSQVIRHKGYVVSYNADYKVPNWVLYELNYAETLGNIKRNDKFAVDPQVPEREMAQLTDYRNSGYDRGHMAPNADLNWDVEAQDECFYLSNMCPQGHDFTAGIWLDLENQVRRWAERDSAVTIVCGPVLPRTAAQASPMKKIGKGHVLVPEYFYKIVFAPFSDQPRAIGFVMPNHNEKKGRRNRPVSDYAVTVDSIESLTGIDFFPALQDDVEKAVESSYNLKLWF